MDASEELREIKKLYGEKFVHLCRKLFPTILDKPGELLKILQLKFATNSRTLYDDIESGNIEDAFKKFIFNQYDFENKEVVENKEKKTPYELMSEAGYTLVECTSEEEIQEFTKYYKSEERLCTFRGGRLDSCVVFWAVREGAEDLKREEFEKPQREDEYGTSVMSIQFSKEKESTVSIKNRYNHKVGNPDATFGNNLDRITPGLEQAFRELLGKRGMLLNTKNKENFGIPGYILASDGRYYKYNMEINNIYYCPGNIVIKNGDVHKLKNHEQEILMDYFVLDLKNKKIIVYDANVKDSFIDNLQDAQKINVKRNKEKETKVITITQKYGEPIIIEINRENQIIGYDNSNLEQVGDYFLTYNKTVKQLELLKLKEVGHNFLMCSKDIENVNLPSLEKVGNNFLYYNEKLMKVNFPKMEEVGNDFLRTNKYIYDVNLPNLKQIGNNFLYYNYKLKKIELPSLEQVGNLFLYWSQGIEKINFPKLKKIGDIFLGTNLELTKLNLPNLEQIGNSFLYNNKRIKNLNLPKLKQVKSGFLHSNICLENVNLPKLKKVGYGFLYDNGQLQKVELPSLEEVESEFLYNNRRIAAIILKKLKRKNRCISSGELALLDKKSHLTEIEIKKNPLKKLIEKIRKKFQEKENNK